MPDPLTLCELLNAVEIVDAHIDAATGPDYLAQPLALRWARVTKVCEEAGEVWRALSKMTGENPRKGVCGTEAELLCELGDTVSAGMCAIQHLTKDVFATWAIVSAALIKARGRVSEHAARGSDVHVDWHMTTDEWGELREALRCSEECSPYIQRLRAEGKLDA